MTTLAGLYLLFFVDEVVWARVVLVLRSARV